MEILNSNKQSIFRLVFTLSLHRKIKLLIIKIPIMTFEELGLNKQLLNAITDLDYVYATPIQEQAFAPIKGGRNVVGIAQTGTGKTFAYLLPILNAMKFSNQREPRVLIIAPTHELVIQILQETRKLSEYSNIRSLAVFGGVNMKNQKQDIYDGTDVLIATPGRLLDLAYTGILNLKSIKQVVFDEVDEMFSLGFRTQITNLLEMLPEKKQMVMFSATMSDEAIKFMKSYVYNPLHIEIAPHGTPIEKINQTAYFVPNFNTKANLLQLLLKEDTSLSKVMVFAKSKKQADKLLLELTPENQKNAAVIHSNKAHNTRMNAMKKFISGEVRVLISTDVVARGMDINDVSHIINFDISENPGDYMHRIGRTGRADKVGNAISFINEMEQENHTQIEILMGKIVKKRELPEELVISNEFADDEKPSSGVDKNYLTGNRNAVPIGAFHEKKAKNKKENSGSAARNKKEYTKSGSRKKYGGRRR
ncbi:MAG: ATP-dependent helicase [Bacteroidetes bacterium]|nr:MAG: ATP-dependent helicase [Bacteroidota bacterium]